MNVVALCGIIARSQFNVSTVGQDENELLLRDFKRKDLEIQRTAEFRPSKILFSSLVRIYVKQ